MGSSSFFGGDGKGSFYGFAPASPAPIEMVVRKMSAALSKGGQRRSTTSSLSTEEWEVGTFVGSEDEVVAGNFNGKLGWRSNTL